MNVEENRNCNCGYHYDSDNTDAMPVMTSNNDYDECDTRREMINQIRSLDFAIVELALYLDTHPDDQKALCLHNKYCKEVDELKDQYQKAFGPLTINYPCNKWRWLEEPWPWERGNY